jgi:hypothetical protein
MDVLQIKAAVRARDGFKCLECGMTQADHLATYGQDLDVHRVVPGSAYSTDPGVCQTLCRRCHGPKPRRPHGSLGEPPKLVVDVDPVVKLAIKLRAIFLGGRWTIADVVNGILCGELPSLEAEIAQAEKYIALRQPPPAAPES